jgi:uncharacterized protein (UPF0303 family)
MELQDLLQQEKELQFTEFTNETALEIGLRIIKQATAENKNFTIGIRRNGQRLFHYAMPGTTRDNDSWVERKSNLAERFGHSSYYMFTFYQSLGMTMQQKSQLSETDYAASGGAFPIFIKNVGSVGVITVSGLPHEEDHKFVVSVIQNYLAEKIGLVS